MKRANDQMTPAQTAAIMREFAVQSETMGLREELMDDALIDAFDEPGELSFRL